MSNTPSLNILTINEAEKRISEERKQGKRIVMTNGCYDLLHVGHISSLKFAKEHGEVLVVAVNDDDSVKKLKGEWRPIIPIQYRMEMLSELKVVDYVIPFHQQNALSVIKIVKPDIYVKGADYNLYETPEGIEVINYGGKIVCAPLIQGISTTSIINKINQISVGEENG